MCNMFGNRTICTLRSLNSHRFKNLRNLRICNRRNFALAANINDSDAKFVNSKDSYQGFKTVDSNEIDFHSSIKDEWWNTTGSMRGLHALNKLRVPLIRDGLLENCTKLKGNNNFVTPLNGCDILDVGCGGGILSEALARIGAEVTGLDASEQLIDLAKEHITLSDIKNLNYVYDTIENYSEQHKEAFDAVVLSEVIEHVTEKDSFVQFCLKTLRPGGSIFVTTLNKTTLSWFGGILCAENILKIVPKGTHQWDKFISPEELSILMEKYNCKTKLVHGMMYFIHNNEWCWTSNTSINYAMHFIKRNP